MKLIVPKMKKVTFDCPEGLYKGKLLYVRPKKDDETTKIRFLFQADVPKMEKFKVLVQKRLYPDLHPGTPLREFLERWKGPEFFEEGKEIDLCDLEDEECEMTIVHHHNPGHEKPYCEVGEAYPLGTTSLTQKVNGKGVGI
jgi:hypothetical protein